MEGALWVFAALSLATFADSASLPPAARAAGRSELISEAIDNYNKESDSKSVFLLLVDEDGAETEPPAAENEVRFVIKETLCQKSENKTADRCQFKSGGVEKRCRASIKENQFTVSCRSITDGTAENGGGDRNGHKHTAMIHHGAEEEEEMSPEDEDDDYPPDTIIQFHDDDHHDHEVERQPQGETRGLLNGGLLERLLCLRCIIDIFPRK